ncbi:DedA family protein [Sphaerotilus sp.]|uniref:DedA family protein n=1 Tax=Sphaerotilus sp. TaxID=2093942 RepID=UPI002ACE70F9|nr:VTT domain-containing protein [Sphaerotilus sp.]MDZ7858868.1 VTT domain-containing protein [Sphaerotilus sp.]
MTDLTEFLLTSLLNHGALVLGGTLFFAALGVPLPATMLLVATGAFSQHGVMGWQAAAGVAVVAAVAGDGCSYLLGRLVGERITSRWKDSKAWRSAEQQFERWGIWTVFLSRFLFTPIALPVNLIAGSTRFPWPRFLMAVVVGEVIWVLLFGGLGLLFADNWEALSQMASDVSGVLVGLLLLGVGAYALLRRG